MAKKKAAGTNEGEGKQEQSAILNERPTVTITHRDGTQTTYEMGGLGIIHTMRLARVLAAGIATIGPEAGPLDQLTVEKVAWILISCLPFAEEETFQLLADLIGEDPERLKDKDLFPMGSEMDIIFKLAEHEDLRAFFDKLKHVLTSGALDKLSRSGSTKSKRGTGGRTKKS